MNSQQLWSKICRQFIATTILSTSVLAYASDYPLEDDVSSIDGVIKAYYGVVSGPAGFEYDHERDRIVERFGDLAHVWSTFEARNTPDGVALGRGVSSVSLYYRNDRWWIASWSSQNETDEMLPAKYAPVPDTK